MARLFESCAERPVAISMLAIMIVLAGILSVRDMPIARLPEISVPQLVVEATMPGLPAREIRNLLAIPLEDALSSAKGVTGISSISRDGIAIITLDFRWGDDIVRAASRVRELVDAAWQALPAGTAKPVVLPRDPASQALMVIAFASLDGQLSNARRFVELEAMAVLRRIDGIGNLVLAGGMGMEVAVNLDIHKAAAMGMSISDCASIIAGEIRDIPAGSVREAETELVAIARGRPESISGLSSLTLAGLRGQFSLSSLATVSRLESPRESAFVADGKEYVGLFVYPKSGSNPLVTARKGREAVVDLMERFETSIAIRILDDSSASIAESMKELVIAGITGTLAVIIVLLLIFRQIRPGVLVASTIPLSVLGSFSFLRMMGTSLNGMSLGGIGLAIGMISDNALVVINALMDIPRDGCPTGSECAKALSDVFMGTLGSTLTTVIVFIPVLFLPGAIGGIFADLALAIIFTIVLGWLLAIFALPAMYRMFCNHRYKDNKRKLEKRFRKLLAFSFRHPLWITLSAIIFSALGFFIALTRPLSFLPEDRAERFELSVDFKAGSDPDGIISDALKISGELSSLAGLDTVFGYAGSEQDDYGKRADPAYLRERLTLLCILARGAEPASAKKAIMEIVKETAPADALFKIIVPPEPAAKLLGLDGNRVVRVKARSPAELERQSQIAVNALKHLAGESLAELEWLGPGKRATLRLLQDRELVASMGMKIAHSAAIIRIATEGADIGSIETDGISLPIRLYAQGYGRQVNYTDCLEAIPIAVENEMKINAGSLGDFVIEDSESFYYRQDRADAVSFLPHHSDGKKSELDKALALLVNNNDSLEVSDSSAFHRYRSVMIQVVILVILLLYLLLGAQFESFFLPLPIMSTIPLSLAGIGPAMLLADTGLDSGSIVGMVVLFGVVVNNAILLRETTEQRLGKGLSRRQAAYAGASDRVRPVLATTFTTMVALFPICLLNSGAAQRSMSVAMLGGITASTILSLFIAPLLFSIQKPGGF